MDGYFYDTGGYYEGVDTSQSATQGSSVLDYIMGLGQLGLQAYATVSGQPSITQTPSGAVYTGQAAVQQQQTKMIWGLVIIVIVAWLIFRK